MDITDDILIQVDTKYLSNQSNPEDNKFIFSYTIIIVNNSPEPVQLLSRHWIIVDGNNKHEEVIGEGVIGEQPIIAPYESFEYTSGSVLETEVGAMEGFYDFKFSDDSLKKARIPRFILSIPRVLH